MESETEYTNDRVDMIDGACEAWYGFVRLLLPLHLLHKGNLSRAPITLIDSLFLHHRAKAFDLLLSAEDVTFDYSIGSVISRIFPDLF